MTGFVQLVGRVSVHTSRTYIRHGCGERGGHGRREAVTQARALGLLGPIITRWPGAEDVVMMTSLQDPVAEVRQLALLTMWEASSPGLAGALHWALLDRDPGVRARAKGLFRRVPVEDPGD